ncbi:MAG: XdhC family protein [Actinobacteria bacterium]|nr:XdhC family protein [Actinomycetota bacterium]MCA1721989.1 XdhC family protein [Actinomycetota bacterium]
MRDIAAGLRDLLNSERPFGLATVVGTRGSAPRPPGAAMAVDADGVAVGSVSGGCVEGAVYEVAADVLAGGPPVVETYGISDETAYSVGLTCGGILDVLVQRVGEAQAPVLRELLDLLERDEPVALATVTGGPAPLGALRLVTASGAAGSLGTEGLDAAATDDARGMLAIGSTGTRHYGPRGERRIDDVSVFVQAFTPPPRMLVFGATDFAAAVARAGVFLGYRVTVCDARPVFATPRRFPEAHEVVCRWPHDYLTETEVDERTVIAVLTHDPKFDVPLLEVALRSRAGYVGAMGSRRTHDDRLGRLRDIGMTEEELSRLHSPIGLDLGARTPEETAVSIAAEIVQHRWGGSGRPLGNTDGPVHR